MSVRTVLLSLRFEHEELCDVNKAHSSQNPSRLPFTLIQVALLIAGYRLDRPLRGTLWACPAIYRRVSAAWPVC